MQRHLGQSRVNRALTELGHMGRGGGKGREEGGPGTTAKKAKVQKWWKPKCLDYLGKGFLEGLVSLG